MPLNVDREKDLSRWVDDVLLQTFHYRNSKEAGCWAKQEGNAAFLKRLAAASRGQARFRLDQGEEVELLSSRCVEADTRPMHRSVKLQWT